MGRCSLTDAAKSDIREITSYIRERNPTAARTVRQELQSTMRRLADFPGMGHVRPEFGEDDVRVWALYSYLIIYRACQKLLEVLRVVQGARDLRDLLRKC